MHTGRVQNAMGRFKRLGRFVSALKPPGSSPDLHPMFLAVHIETLKTDHWTVVFSGRGREERI